MRLLRQTCTALACVAVLTACKKDDDDNTVKPLTLGPLADFSISGGECAGPCTVTFYNTTANATSYSWNFGDGTPLSTAATSTVTHTYQQAGTYTVTLTAKGADGATGSKVLDVVINAAPTPAQLISARPYLMTNLDAVLQGSTFPMWSLVSACERDNRHEFRSGGTYQVTDAGAVCSPSLTTSGTWSLNADNTRLTLRVNGEEHNLEVISLTDTMLKLSEQDSIFGQPATIITTYTAQ